MSGRLTWTLNEIYDSSEMPEDHSNQFSSNAIEKWCEWIGIPSKS